MKISANKCPLMHVLDAFPVFREIASIAAHLLRFGMLAALVGVATGSACAVFAVSRTQVAFGPPEPINHDLEDAGPAVLTLPAQSARRARIVDAHAYTVGPTRRVDLALSGEQGWEPSIVVAHADPIGTSDEVVATWIDGRAGAGDLTDTRIGIARTVDDGTHWNTHELVPPPQSAGIQFDPMTATDDNSGRTYVGAMSRHVDAGRVDTVWIAEKDAGEPEFAAPTVVFAENGVDKGWMVGGPLPDPLTGSALYLAYNFGVQRSLDAGASFEAPLFLPAGVGYQSRVGPSGVLRISYYAADGTAALIESSDALQTLSAPVAIGTFAANRAALGAAVAGDFRVPPFVMHCADPNSGRIYAIYNDVTQIVGGQDDVNLLLRDSVDGGQTWSPPRIVNGDASPPGDQVMPWIECDAYGRLHLAYFDDRRNPASDSAPSSLLDVYYSMSSDGGHTWQESRLTEIPLDTSVSNWNTVGIPRQFVGDYLGVAVSRHAAYIAYPGSVDSGTGVGMFVTRIDLDDRIFANGFE